MDAGIYTNIKDTFFFNPGALRSKMQCYLSNDVVSRGKKTVLASKNKPYHSTSFHQDSRGHFGVAFLPPLISLHRAADTGKWSLPYCHMPSSPWGCQRQVGREGLQLWKEGCSDPLVLVYELLLFSENTKFQHCAWLFSPASQLSRCSVSACQFLFLTFVR